ncbi:MAG: oligosaccharide flippase family protein [Prevotellaceae bacterium]|jgi:O-antigen/teichoic acid export membrane protein|nr:oligosaccharide flippase family protein [Prevotellaceae bacterium]
MAKQIKSLAKDTAIYGLSSIIGKFVNWLLVPLYTHVLASPADYGIVTNLYSWTALLLVVLTYGMETGFFRFINNEKECPDRVYSTSMISVGSTSLLFAVLVFAFSPQIATLLHLPAHPEYIWLLGISVALDAFASIPFACLRYRKMPIRFAALKMLYVALNVILNLFFYIACPYLLQNAPASVEWFYNPAYGVGYVFVANMISTVIQTLCLAPYIFVVKFRFDRALMNRILRYSLPLLLLGIAGIMNQTLDKILYPYLRNSASGDAELGIYGATSKMALVMLMFTQAFRFAYEPFVFAQKRDKKSHESYIQAMNYFVIVSWFIFLGMVFYIDFFKLIIDRQYWSGLDVVPIILVSFIFQGIFFNLSIWYKLSDKTMFGAWFSLLGTVIIIAGNVLLVPQYGYYGCVWAAFACYFVIMLFSYIVGQKYMPIAYNLKKIGFYTFVALALFLLSFAIKTPYQWLNYILKTILMFAFLLIFIKNDLPTAKIPILNKIFKKKL